MQNNVTELTNRLLRALDNNYNVIDMPAVIEIVSLLEKVSITKELLETTRLGKHVNELRRKTNNDSLSKRAKELVKKWRNMVLPDSTNGQLKQTDSVLIDNNKKRPLTKSPPTNQDVKRAKLNGQLIQQIGGSELDMSDNSNSSFKDVISSTKLMKRDVILINSDSNSSFPEMKQEPLLEQQLPKKRGRKKGSKNHKNLLDEAETSFTNKLAVSRGNSKVKTTQELIAGLQNKNNTNSTNPNLGTSPIKSKEDLNIRAAKLTERVSIIDQKLNTNANRYKNSQKKNLQQTKIHLGEKSDRIIESGSVINDKSLIIKHEQQTDEEVIVVDDLEPTVPVKNEVFDQHDSYNEDSQQQQQQIDDDVNKVRSLSVEEALAQLPPIDKSVLDDEINSLFQESICTCILKESENIVSEPNGDDDDDEVENNDESGVIKSNLLKKYEFIEDSECEARLNHIKKYENDSLLTPNDLHTKYLENINGNWGVGLGKSRPELTKDGLYVNVVPNVNIEHIPKDVKCDFSCENYKKYNVSECDNDNAAECGENINENERRTAKIINNCVERDEESVIVKQEKDDEDDEEQDVRKVFREWHEVLDKPSYNGEILKILPYVIID